MRIITPAGDVVAEGKTVDYVRMSYGVQNLDGSHMEAGRIYPVPDYFRVQLVGGYRAHQATAEEFEAQQAADASVPAIDPAVITNGDPVIENRDPKPRKK